MSTRRDFARSLGLFLTGGAALVSLQPMPRSASATPAPLDSLAAPDDDPAALDARIRRLVGAESLSADETAALKAALVSSDKTAAKLRALPVQEGGGEPATTFFVTPLPEHTPEAADAH